MVSTHLKNISQIGSFPQVGVKIKNIWNHQPARNGSAKKKHQKTHCFLPRVSNRSMVSTHPPCTSPKTAFTAASPAAATALGPVMTSGHQPVTIPSLGGKNPFSEWLFTYFFYFEEMNFLNQQFFTHRGFVLGEQVAMQEFSDVGGWWFGILLCSLMKNGNESSSQACVLVYPSIKELNSESRHDTPGILKNIARLRRWSLWIIPCTMPVNH